MSFLNYEIHNLGTFFIIYDVKIIKLYMYNNKKDKIV